MNAEREHVSESKGGNVIWINKKMSLYLIVIPKNRCFKRVKYLVRIASFIWIIKTKNVKNKYYFSLIEV